MMVNPRTGYEGLACVNGCNPKRFRPVIDHIIGKQKLVFAVLNVFAKRHVIFGGVNNFLSMFILLSYQCHGLINGIIHALVTRCKIPLCDCHGTVL